MRMSCARGHITLPTTTKKELKVGKEKSGPQDETNYRKDGRADTIWMRLSPWGSSSCSPVLPHVVPCDLIILSPLNGNDSEVHLKDNELIQANVLFRLGCIITKTIYRKGCPTLLTSPLSELTVENLWPERKEQKPHWEDALLRDPLQSLQAMSCFNRLPLMQVWLRILPTEQKDTLGLFLDYGLLVYS